MNKLTLTQPDWTRYLDPNGLAEKSGVPEYLFAEMILKELADNAADIGGASLTFTDKDTFVIRDGGQGVPLEALSIKRPLTSSKHWRLGERGALGNGLRAVMGALHVLDGKLIVHSQGRATEVHINGAGDTITRDLGDSTETSAIEVILPYMEESAGDMAMTALATPGGVVDSDKAVPQWFDVDAMKDLLRSADGVTLGDFVSQFATRWKPADPYAMASAQDAGALLANLQSEASAEPKIQPLGRGAFMGEYAKVQGKNGPVPFVIEVYATAHTDGEGEATTTFITNRTQTLLPMTVDMDKRGRVKIHTTGQVISLGRGQTSKQAMSTRFDYDFTVSISTPYFPILSSGKAIDIFSFSRELLEAVISAGRKAAAAARKPKTGITIMDAVEQLLPAAYERVSDGGRLWANLRQLMYAMRPDILKMTGKDSFSDNHVTQVCIPQFADPSWKIAADARGAMMEPHTGRRVGVGTVEVFGYTADRTPLRFQRPVEMSRLITNLAPHERIRRLLYIEKEGFSELIEGSGLLERFDMAMVSTKGMSVIAARRLIDHLVGANPDFEVYALVDFDITGADILRTLTLDTDRFVFNQCVDVRQIGVTWDQAQVLHDRGLSEPVDLKGNGDDIQRRLSWASGLSAEATNFLAGTHPRRVELNAFTSQELLDIIETSVTGGKLIPADRLESTWAEMMVRAKVAAYEEEVRKQPPATAVDGLMELVQALLLERPELSWDEAVAILAAEAA